MQSMHLHIGISVNISVHTCVCVHAYQHTDVCIYIYKHIHIRWFSYGRPRVQGTLVARKLPLLLRSLQSWRGAVSEASMGSWSESELCRGQRGHVNIRLPPNRISGPPSYWALEPGCSILLCVSWAPIVDAIAFPNLLGPM